MSELLSNSSKVREELTTRNLYTPSVQYPLQNSNNVDRMVDSINSIVGGITPFKSINLDNTVFGRLVTSDTPLAKIGLTMLGKQFALNAASHAAQQNFPIINLSNLFDGDKNTNVITQPKDLRITKRNDTNWFENFLDKVVYFYPNDDNPFVKNSTNSDKIMNTGSGQLQFLYSAINKNVYKLNEKTNSVFHEYADIVSKSIEKRSDLISNNKKFFNFSNQNQYPYLNYYPMSSAEENANLIMVDSYTGLYVDDDNQEYAPTQDYIANNFGKSSNKDVFTETSLDSAGIDSEMNKWIGGNPVDDKLVWGRDGTDYDYNEKLTAIPDDVTVDPFVDVSSKFNIRTGILEYTRNLVNATEGRIGDLTRKAFTNGNKIVGFNGSALWEAPSTSLPEFEGKKGVRQHSALDNYDRYAKAIRFNGNKIYNKEGGNKDSVIYDSVMPRIHPTLNSDGKVNPKNLMLSIENLAINVISKDNLVGIIDDEYGSQIPVCEVGPFNGRIMWFPPYNMEIVENAEAKYEPTVMVGRNEPMYNYQNSERTATLNFTMLIDHPPQVEEFQNSTNPEKDLAEFFAFGTTNKPKVDTDLKGELEYDLLIKENELEELTNPGTPKEVNIRDQKFAYVYFPNDIPKINADLNTVIDDMYKGGYEIMENIVPTSFDAGHFGLNKEIYFISGITQTTGTHGEIQYVLNPPTPTFSQYTAVGTNNQLGDNSVLNVILRQFFDDEETRQYYEIDIVGGASKLYTENDDTDITEGSEYNKALGLRRAQAASILIKKRLKTLYGKDVDKLGISVLESIGSIGDEHSAWTGGTAAAIPLRGTKQERAAKITIRRSATIFEKSKKKLTPDEEQKRKELVAEIENIKFKLNYLNRTGNLTNKCVMKEKKRSDKIENNGFNSIKENYYVPVFHSQTPEDFHKRLTFLQQCTRQGSAQRYDVKADDNGTLRARNSVFGRQPICILRVGDFFYTKVVITSVNFDYNETTWDMNPEGFGMQPMIANITLSMKIIGGQSLKGPIDALQNAVSFNYYANSNFTNKGLYNLPSRIADAQASYLHDIEIKNKEKEKEKNNETKSVSDTLGGAAIKGAGNIF